MGFDIIRFVGEVDEELLCPICTGVLQDPVQVKFIFLPSPSIHINNTKHFMSLLRKVVKSAFFDILLCNVLSTVYFFRRLRVNMLSVKVVYSNGC